MPQNLKSIISYFDGNTILVIWMIVADSVNCYLKVSIVTCNDMIDMAWLSKGGKGKYSTYYRRY